MDLKRAQDICGEARLGRARVAQDKMAGLSLPKIVFSARVAFRFFKRLGNVRIGP